MKKEPIILSISILISGRKEMRQCLESIKPLLQQVSSELILVDTGCNEEQLSIAREYTDIIVPFTWCNDFSAARNAGLCKACGEWFLFLDDDEWFGDVREIIDFFQTGEYRKYRCARYYQRNYSTRTGAHKPFVDNVVLRMTQMLPNTRFHGIIHEFLTPAEAPIKDFACYVEHYGYIFDNERDKYRHVERNASLLYKQIELEPTVIRWYSQLAQEYMGIHEYEQVLQICQKAFDVWDGFQQVDNTQVRSIGAIYGYAAKACEQKFDFEQALDWIQKGISAKLIYDCAKAYLYQIQSEIYYDKKAYSECLKAFLTYRDIYQKKGKDQYAIAMETSLINNTVFQEIPHIRSILRGLQAAIKVGKIELAKELFDSLDWNDKRLFGQDELENDLIQCVAEKQNVCALEMLKTLGEREHGILELAPLMAAWEKKYMEEDTANYVWNLRNAVACIKGEHHYILACQIMLADRNDESDRLKDLYNELFLHCERIFKLDKAIWAIASKHQICIEDFLLKSNYNQWKNGCEEWIAQATTEQMKEWQERIHTWKTKEDIRYEFFELRVSEALFYHRIEKSEFLQEDEISLLEHAERVITFYQKLYREDVFQTVPEALPLEVQLALNLKKVRYYREKHDDKNTIESLRKCVGLYPVLEKPIAQYAKMCKDEIQEHGERQEQERKEFAILVKSLKDAAKQRMNCQMYEEAYEILRQIKQCIPDDKEVTEMMRQLREMEKK